MSSCFYRQGPDCGCGDCKPPRFCCECGLRIATRDKHCEPCIEILIADRLAQVAADRQVEAGR